MRLNNFNCISEEQTGRSIKSKDLSIIVNSTNDVEVLISRKSLNFFSFKQISFDIF
ncbi:hypothetical protein D3C84_1187770 [compost metagenome]